MPVHPDAVSQTWVEEAKRESGIYIMNIIFAIQRREQPTYSNYLNANSLVDQQNIIHVAHKLVQ